MNSLEAVIVAVVIAGAVAFLARYFIKSGKNGSCTGCENCPMAEKCKNSDAKTASLSKPDKN